MPTDASATECQRIRIRKSNRPLFPYTDANETRKGYPCAKGIAMLITTTDVIPGRAYQPLGLVRGNVAYCKHLGRDIMVSFKNLAGGEINSYTDMLNEARDIAEARMVDQAARLGADAIVGMRFMNDTVCEGTIEVIAYGTAVKLQ